MRTTRGVIFRQGYDRICLCESVETQTHTRVNQHFQNGVGHLSVYWPRNPPLRSFKFLCGVSGCATSDFHLGEPPGKIRFLFGEMKGLHFPQKPPIWEPPKSTKAGAPTVFSLAHLGKLNRYSHIYDAGGYLLGSQKMVWSVSQAATPPHATDPHATGKGQDITQLPQDVTQLPQECCLGERVRIQLGLRL